MQIPFWDQFQTLLFQALLYFKGFTGDWGMAIILFTIAIRVILLPLTWKQTKSMVELQRIQPKIKELNEKYKDDKEKLQEETLKFYADNKVNPLGGCLPLLLQMPILIALYGVLGGRGTNLGKMMAYLQANHQTGTLYSLIPNIAKTPQAMWDIHNPLAALPYIILVIIFGVSVWLPQALMPGDQQQKLMGGSMALVMLWFGWFSPAGVLLYWDVSSLWGVAQQQITMTITKRELQAAEAEADASKKKPAAATSDTVSTKKPSNKKSKKS